METETGVEDQMREPGEVLAWTLMVRPVLATMRTLGTPLLPWERRGRVLIQSRRYMQKRAVVAVFRALPIGY